MPSDPPTLDQIEEMDRNATPAPWTIDTENWTAGELYLDASDGPDLIETGWRTDGGVMSDGDGLTYTTAADMRLIAALRNAAPGLLRLWRAARTLEEWACAHDDTDYWHEFIIRTGDRDGEDWYEFRAALADLEAKEGEDE